MSSTTTYRAEFRTRPGLRESDAAEAMLPLSRLPVHEARAADFDWYGMPAMIGTDGTFRHLVPIGQPPAPAFWSFDGRTLTVAVDLLNPHYRDDDQPEVVVARPNRGDTLLFCLSLLVQGEEGTIVGGWQGEHSDDWNPLIVADGAIARAYAPSGRADGRERPLTPHPARVDPSRLIRDPETGTVSIEAEPR